MRTDRTGVILMNLGTPTDAKPKAVRKFLKEFLSDQRVVELPRLIWLPILYGVILPFRATRVARLYKQIWRVGGSPLKVITEEQVAKLQTCFSENKIKITYAMTYGAPKLSDCVAELEQQGYQKIFVLPLYPQFSATTTGPVYDQYAALIRQQRNISDITIKKNYYDRPDYIDALVQSILDHWQNNKPAEKLLFSFHGIPKRCVDKGDPYQEHCVYTAKQVASRLRLDDSQWQLSFQSRLGKAEWLKPYTDQLLVQMASEGVESVDVICPAFAADCLETLEEIEVENRDLFLSAGGRRFNSIPCLNASVEHIEMMKNIVNEFVYGSVKSDSREIENT